MDNKLVPVQVFLFAMLGWVKSVAWGGMGTEVWDFHFLKGLFLKIWRMFWLEG
jgi:hypothetical protein